MDKPIDHVILISNYLKHAKWFGESKKGNKTWKWNIKYKNNQMHPITEKYQVLLD